MNIARDFIVILIIAITLLALNIFVWGPSNEHRPTANPPVEVEPDRGTSIDT